MVLGICAEWRKRLAPNTIYTYSCQLRSLLRTLRECGSPPIQIPKTRGPRPRETVATPQDIERLLAACAPMPWMRLFILLCWQTALRFSEALAVTPRSYDRQSNTAAIRTKGGKIRVIPMTEDIADLLRATLEGDPDRSCIHILKGSACSPQAIRSQWYRITSALQLTHINPHDLRRTTATNLYAVTNDIRAVQQYLGHDRMSSTLSYLAPLGDQKLREMHEKLRFFVKKDGPVN
jgi:integrase